MDELMKNQAYFHSATLKICHGEQSVIIKKSCLEWHTFMAGRERKERQREATAEMDSCEREREGSER